MFTGSINFLRRGAGVSSSCSLQQAVIQMSLPKKALLLEKDSDAYIILTFHLVHFHTLQVRSSSMYHQLYLLIWASLSPNPLKCNNAGTNSDSLTFHFITIPFSGVKYLSTSLRHTWPLRYLSTGMN